MTLLFSNKGFTSCIVSESYFQQGQWVEMYFFRSFPILRLSETSLPRVSCDRSWILPHYPIQFWPHGCLTANLVGTTFTTVSTIRFTATRWCDYLSPKSEAFESRPQKSRILPLWGLFLKLPASTTSWKIISGSVQNGSGSGFNSIDLHQFNDELVLLEIWCAGDYEWTVVFWIWKIARNLETQIAFLLLHVYLTCFIPNRGWSIPSFIVWFHRRTKIWII